MGSDYPATSERPARQSPSEEGREQIIARRRAAQLVWRRARLRVELAGHALAAVERGPQTAATADCRRLVEQAALEERSARSLYSRVAEETGALLSRLHRAKAHPTM